MTTPKPLSLNDTAHARFEAKVLPASDGCHLWTGCTNRDGYGIFSPGGNAVMVLAHRAAWVLAGRPDPTPLCLLHTCDLRLCVNVDHLIVGTRVQNNADRDTKNRTARGERQGLAKLTEDDVHEIRALYATGRYRQVDLGRLYGIDGSNISRLVNHKQWAHVA